MTQEEPDESQSSEEPIGKTQRMQTGKLLKTNTMTDESINQSASVVAPKQRAVPAFLKGPTAS